ncbi:Uncharacterised protein g11185 [Pycnogonum litorale]
MNITSFGKRYAVQNILAIVRQCSNKSHVSEIRGSAPSSSASVKRNDNQAKSDVHQSSTQAEDDNTTYKVPEYYSHDKMSYIDYEVELSQYRIPQPSSL